jgi:hypothetical protein
MFSDDLEYQVRFGDLLAKVFKAETGSSMSIN